MKTWHLAKSPDADNAGFVLWIVGGLAVFSSEQNAQRYLDARGWKDMRPEPTTQKLCLEYRWRHRLADGE